MKKYYLSGLISLAALQGQAAPLPTQGQPLEEIIVTGTHIPQKHTDSLSHVTVITSEQIASAGQSTLIELLQAYGNIEIASNGGPGQTSSIFMRGTNSNHTLVLLDGMRIGSATTGTTAIESIPLEQIDHIEILKGAASSLYGSDAIGGVIQIFTRTGKGKPTLNAKIGVGSYNSQTASAGVLGAQNDTHFALNIAKSHTEGFSSTNPRAPFNSHNADKDGYTNTSFSGKLGHLFNKNHEIGLTALYSDGKADFDSDPFSDDVNHRKLATVSLFSRNRINSIWESQTRLSKSMDNSRFSGSPFSDTFRTDQRQLNWTNNFTFNFGTLTAGVDYTHQKVSSEKTPYTTDTRNIRSLFAGYAGKFRSHNVQLTVRNDENDQYGNPTTGLASYGYQIAPAWKAVASAGTAFHAPTFNDLYYPFGLGNANLLPEESKTYEAGLHFDQHQHHAAINIFDTRVNNLIVYSPDTFSMLNNIPEAHIRGLELSYRGEWADFHISGAATFQDALNEEKQQQLPRRARRHANLAISKPFGAWKFGSEAILTGRRYDGIVNTEANHLAGFALFNLTASYSFNKDINVRARVNNIFNKDYEQVYGYNTPKRNLFVSLGYTFQ